MKSSHLSLLLTALLCASSAIANKPNIVFIMADDLGPGWVDYDDSNPEINTPNLERM
ncbi:MAG TPA: arylsulfatase, partial [Lentisphaeria bacterium]|nr:arylsulfatase [Lentisphaeria bacterium]